MLSRVGFIGLGKLGLPVALAVESKGYEVCGYDVSEKVREFVATKKIPYMEEGAQELLGRSKIRHMEMGELCQWADMLFVCVQTPHARWKEGDAPGFWKEPEDFDYSYLRAALRSTTTALGDKKAVVVVISTVLPGTMSREIFPCCSTSIRLVYNPSFIAMGTAVRDYLFPEFVLAGSDDADALNIVKEFYSTITNAPFFNTKIINAELIKMAYNTFIGMKITFANSIMEICENVGADCDSIIDGLSLATRRVISPMYMRGGMGDGGGCHPRDNAALSFLAKRHNMSCNIFEKVLRDREDQTKWLVDRTLSILENVADLKRIVVLGKAYKEESNLTNGSPALLFTTLLKQGVLAGQDCGWLSKDVKVESFDPYLDSHDDGYEHILCRGPAIYFIATRHEEFKNYRYPSGSIVIDPWRYIPKNYHDVRVAYIGKDWPAYGAM